MSARSKVDPLWYCVPLIFLLGQGIVLLRSGLAGDWIWGADGKYVATDFVGFWTTGLQIRVEQAAAAYDWERHAQWERAFFDTEIRGFAGWHYPPTFLFVAWVLATVPYPAALLAWCASNLALYGAAIAGVIRRRLGILLALSFPPVVWNVLTGQTGLLTAALMSASLLQLQHRPYLAGAALGFLTYKPQFGLLFPFALIAGGYWKAIASATLTAAVLVGTSGWVFGPGVWPAFFADLSEMQKAVLELNLSGPYKLQSLFGWARLVGADSWTALFIHGIFALGVAAVVVWLWFQAAPFELKAASLALGSVLVSPYVFSYDLVLLAIPLAFLLRMMMRSDFRKLELYLAVLAAVSTFVVSLMRAPTGFLAALLIGVMIVLRLGFVDFRTQPPE